MKKALAKQPGQRFQSGREFAQALQAAIAGQAAAPVAAGQHGPAAAAAPPRAAPGGAAPLAARHRRCAAAATRGRAVGRRHGRRGRARPRAHTSCSRPAGHAAPIAQGGAAPAAAAPAQPAAPVASRPAAPAAAAAAQRAACTEAGTLVISALGLVDPQDARFNGNLAAAQLEARNDAKRQLVEKALALYVDTTSLDKNYALHREQAAVQLGRFHPHRCCRKARASAGKDGLVEMPTRAVVSLRDMQKSLNQLSREERIEFIRNKGDPRISIRIDIGNDGGGAIGARAFAAGGERASRTGSSPSASGSGPPRATTRPHRTRSRRISPSAAR